MTRDLSSISVIKLQTLRMTLDKVQFRLVEFGDRHRQLSEATAAGRVYEIDETSQSSFSGDLPSAHSSVDDAEPLIVPPLPLNTGTPLHVSGIF